MRQRILSAALALCLCILVLPMAHSQDGSPVPTPAEAYAAMTALQAQDYYKEGAAWTNETHEYTWKGGTLDGNVNGGRGCVAFAFRLSDTAFGSLPARMYANGAFAFSDVKVGDILRVNNGAHTVIVLQVTDGGVVIAEANYHESGSEGKVHWGRVMSKADVEAASHYITRYPEGYVPPDDPSYNDPIEGGAGVLDGGLSWTLTKGGALTISGSGAMPDFNPASDQPWYQFKDQIQKIVVEDGVTSIGLCAFQESKALSVSIPDSVTVIGNNAFKGSSIVSVTIPASVKTVSDDAFRDCANLTAATVSDGVEIIGQRAFRGCQKLNSIALPASVEQIGAGAFYDCVELADVAFAPGNKQVQLGNDLFARCWRLGKVTLPQNMDRISSGMFQNCYVALFTLNIPQGVKSIGGSAFASCSSLASVKIPDSVTEIETAAFSGCGGLTDIYFAGSEAQWNSISKTADVQTALEHVTVHYNSSDTDPGPGPDGHEHSWSTAWSKDSSAHWHECSAANCDITGNSGKDGYGAHSYGDWVVDRDATAYQSGSRHRTCTVCGYSQTDTIPATGGGSSSDNSSSSSNYTPSSTTTTTRNPDGSTTTTKTDNRTGTVTVTTRNTDGSQTAVETKKDGTVTTRETDRDGNRTETVAKPDGSSTVIAERKDGSAATVVTDASGRAEAEVSLSAAAVSAARQNGGIVTLPIPELQPAQDAGTAPTVTVNTGDQSPVKVKIPTAYSTPGTVAVIVRADGTEEVIKTSVPMEDAVAVALPDGAVVKIVDKNKNFTDVPSRNWAANAIRFVSARELFAGTSENTFTPNMPMTHAMLVTVLARLDGADTTGGATWYEKSMEWAAANGVSDDGNPSESVTREQLVMMLWRYAGSPAATGDLSGFTDTDQLNGFAQEAMCWAVENGIISGFGDGQLGPKGQATRAQVAQVLMSYIKM